MLLVDSFQKYSVMLLGLTYKSLNKFFDCVHRLLGGNFRQLDIDG